MNDRAVGLLEQYEVEVHKTAKGRGAILCDTNLGSLIFKEYTGNDRRIWVQNSCLEHIYQDGGALAERIIPTKEGALMLRDGDGTGYVLKTWFEGRECNIYERYECLEAVQLLARLHNCMEKFQPSAQEDASLQEIPMHYLVSAPLAEYEKHNRELRRVLKFLRNRGQKTWFEKELQRSLDGYLDQALHVTEQWRQYSYLADQQPECSLFCHGDYQYHNIIRQDHCFGVVNFEKLVRDNPVRDLCLLMRKLLEKNNWSVAFGEELLTTYERIRPLSAYSRIDLYYRLAYPEKFWKIVNFYYNSGKAWIPEKNLEKLQKVAQQETRKQEFLDIVFRV